MKAWAVRPGRSWRRFRAWRAELPMRWRSAVDAAILPLGIWWTLPPHLKDLVAFLMTRKARNPAPPNDARP